MANILPHLPLDVVENVLLPFALESIADAATNGGTVRVCGGSKSERNSYRSSTSSGQDVTCLIPVYLIEFDFFLSEGEPVISLCCKFKPTDLFVFQLFLQAMNFFL